MKRARSRELEGKIRHWSTPPNNGERVNISRGSPINPSSRRLGTYHRVEIRFSFMHESLATPDPVNLDPLIAKLIATRTEGLPYRFDVKKWVPSIRRVSLPCFFIFFRKGFAPRIVRNILQRVGLPSQGKYWLIVILFFFSIEWSFQIFVCPRFNSIFIVINSLQILAH